MNGRQGGAPTVRFAPSPTGRIHIGNARTAILNWLFALKNAGRFLLRFDDTDRERSTSEFERAITADLAWLGIVPDLRCASPSASIVIARPPKS